ADGGLLFFFQAEDGIRDRNVTGVQTCALPISPASRSAGTSKQYSDRKPPSSSTPFWPISSSCRGVTRKARSYRVPSSATYTTSSQEPARHSSKPSPW